MPKWTNKNFTSLAMLFAVAMAVLAAIGAVRNFSPVPHWDMWDGTLGFYIDAQDGIASAWWRQHNEHRVLLSRILFWLDYRFFSGIGIFLILMNYVIVAAGVWVFWIVLRDTENGGRSVQSRRALALFIAGALLFWSQDNNLTWGFQSQFFLAQLLPMCALLWLGRSIQHGDNSRDFAIACFFGVLSTGTMANGVLALPLMFLYALLLRINLRRIALLAVLTALCLTAYFATYVSPPAHGHLSEALRDQPLHLLAYTMAYLGSPFYYMVGKGTFGGAVAALAGSALALGSAWVSLRLVRNARQAPISMALLIFILYIGGTAFGTAGGRLIFGLQSAVSSRYTTPALMAWSAFIVVLYLNTNLWRDMRSARRGGMILGIAAVLMLGYQVKAIRYMGQMQHYRAIAALALELGVRDGDYIGQIYPDPVLPLKLARVAAERGLTVFGKFPYLNLKEKMGNAVAPDAFRACKGGLEDAVALPNAPGYLRIAGWVFDEKSGSSPKLLKIVENDTIIGYAISGGRRKDLAKSVSQAAREAGIIGYLKWGGPDAAMKLIGVDVECQFDLGKLSQAQVRR